MTPGPHPSDLEHYGDALANIRRRAPRALSELHPALYARVCRLISRMEGRVVPWTGYRDEEAQNRAWLRRTSNARFGQSPHNFKPALACDLVLSPRNVRVRESVKNPGWPDLWDNETAEAQSVWQELDRVSASLGLERVRIRRGDKLWPDRPHVQLPDWKRIAGIE